MNERTNHEVTMRDYRLRKSRSAAVGQGKHPNPGTIMSSQIEKNLSRLYSVSGSRREATEPAHVAVCSLHSACLHSATGSLQIHLFRMEPEQEELWKLQELQPLFHVLAVVAVM